MLFRQDGPSLVVHTPAKLNLFLEVLGKRADGYHELETLMVSVALYDTLRFTEEKSDEIRLRSHFAGARRLTDDSTAPLPTGGENLIVRAADLLRKQAGLTRGVRIELCKRIPLAAGLAGGSSNAAATLTALNRLWKLGLSAGELERLASQLGSDVGFFLAGRPAAVCRGRGERIEPLDLPLNLHFVIVRPAEGLSTAAVYRHCRPADRPRSVRPLVEALGRGRLGEAARSLHNALQEPARQLSRDVVRLQSRFSRQPVLGHMMSGSGTACFGLCAHRRQALHTAARLRAENVGSVCVASVRP